MTDVKVAATRSDGTDAVELTVNGTATLLTPDEAQQLSNRLQDTVDGLAGQSVPKQPKSQS